MKKRLLILFILLLSLSFISAQNSSTDIQGQIDLAYDCLDGKAQCSSLSAVERVFSLLSIGKCKAEVIADSLNSECWPNSGCDLVLTSQAILALDKTSADTSLAEQWLVSQNTTPSDLEWYLQIESNLETRCEITYSGSTNKVIVREDKTINTGAGSCLSLSSGDWWLKVSPSCYDREFEISCDEAFKTNLLFKRKTSSILHVSEQTSSASALGTTTEKINSACFMQDGKCDYEGSLWATLILNYKGYNIDSYIPYLTTMADENNKYLPESFLYILTGQDDYRNNLLLKQKSNKFWDESGNKFYDTAIALMSITDEPQEKTQAKDWLLEIQDSNGCWQGNVKNTGFLLYSLWPKSSTSSVYDCEDSGYYCLAESTCQGDILDNYKCPGATKCCSTPKLVQACSEQNGEICQSNENCINGRTESASDLSAGEICCIGGTCEEKISEDECITYGGNCRDFECESGEDRAYYDCSYSQICCIEGEKPSYWWIWFLIILIILLVLGIIFRKKIRPYYDKIISKFKKKPKTFTPSKPFKKAYPPISQKRMVFPKPNPIKKPAKKNSDELDEVLKKLKEMSK